MNSLKQIFLAASVLVTMSMTAAPLDVPSAQAKAYLMVLPNSMPATQC